MDDKKRTEHERTPEEKAIDESKLFHRELPDEWTVPKEPPIVPEDEPDFPMTPLENLGPDIGQDSENTLPTPEDTSVFTPVDDTLLQPKDTPDTDDVEIPQEDTGEEVSFIFTPPEDTPPEEINVIDTADDDIFPEEPVTIQKKKSKKVPIILGSIVALLLAVYLGFSFYFSSHFYFNSLVNGFDVGGKTAEQVDTSLKQSAATHTITLKERGGKTESIASDQVDIQYVSDGKVKELLNTQNPFAWPLELLAQKNRTLEATFSYDDAKLTNVLNQLQAVSGPEVVKIANAHPQYSGTSFTIVNEITGNELDSEKLKAAVKKTILTGTDSLDLETTDCYKKPAFTADSQKVKESTDKMNQYLGATITYTFGDTTEILDRNTVASWLTVDEALEIQFDQELVSTYVANLGDKYDTYGTTRSFQASNSGVINVGGGDYGWLIDQDEEPAALIAAIQAGQPVTREPIYAKKAANRSGRDFGNTYVEINLSAQTMWFYKNGALVVGTPIVTGSIAGGFGSPTGVYDLDYKSTNVTLKGEGYASPVTFWMPYGGDIGIHDASWRTDFGGSIYLNSGSHGCINTPYPAAQAIFNGISDGDPVIVY